MYIEKKVRAVEDYNLDLSEKVYPSTILLYSFINIESKDLDQELYEHIINIVKKYADSIVDPSKVIVKLQGIEQPDGSYIRIPYTVNNLVVETYPEYEIAKIFLENPVWQFEKEKMLTWLGYMIRKDNAVERSVDLFIKMGRLTPEEIKEDAQKSIAYYERLDDDTWRAKSIKRNKDIITYIDKYYSKKKSIKELIHDKDFTKKLQSSEIKPTNTILKYLVASGNYEKLEWFLGMYSSKIDIRTQTDYSFKNAKRGYSTVAT